MKYIFSFEETNYGSIAIEAATTPTRDEVIDAIQSGDAFYKDTEYGEIKLTETDRQAPKNERQHER